MAVYERRRGADWPLFVAGLGAVFITVVRTTAGTKVDLPWMLDGLTKPQFGSLTVVCWHALSAIFAVLAIALFAALRADRQARMAISLVAAGAFGVTSAIFAMVNFTMFGSAFANWPLIPLSIEALLCLFAAWRS